MTQPQQTSKCLLCKKENIGFYRSHDGADIYYYDCTVCGNYGITASTRALQRLDRDDVYILSGVTKNASKNGKQIILTHNNIETLILNATIPDNIFDYVDRMLLFISDRKDEDTLLSKTNKEVDYPFIYSRNARHFEAIIRQCIEMNYIKSSDSSNITLRLTPDGWKRVVELQKSNSVSSKNVFMAMQYGDEVHNNLFKEIFKPAVEKTGFTLVRLDESPSAGLIDNRLRVEIRNCRFLLADVTNENRGAYWEAGYAEGLGKHVIYLCNKKDFDAGRVHFDVNHHTTIIWDETNIDAAAESLKATIRATYPNEAIMEDKV